MQAMAFIFGLAGIALAIKAHSRITKLEEKLKESNVLEQDFSYGDAIK